MSWFNSLKVNWKLISVTSCSTAVVGFISGKSYQNCQKNGESFRVKGNNEEYYVPQSLDSTFPKTKSQLAIFPKILSSVNAAQKIGESNLELRTEDVPEPAQNASRIAQIMRFGFPGLANVRSLDDFILSYDTRNRVPHWVFEHLTPQNVIKSDAVDRSKSDFHEDKSVHQYFRSSNSDYKKSGYDRGHMAAAGNHRQNQNACDQTFLLSNMAPQVGRGFNRDKWNELEHYCRKLVKNSKNVYVCTGPLYLPRMEEDGNLYIHYKVIGANHVSVPTHFFKVIVSESTNGELSLESFILPNAVIEDTTPLATYHVPVDVVERASGLLMFDKIDRSKFKRINGKTSGWF